MRVAAALLIVLCLDCGRREEAPPPAPSAGRLELTLTALNEEASRDSHGLEALRDQLAAIRDRDRRKP